MNAFLVELIAPWLLRLGEKFLSRKALLPIQRKPAMSFNAKSFFASLEAMIQPIGQAVTLMHPGDNVEAEKIALGTALVGALAHALSSALSSAPVAPATGAQPEA